MKDKSISIKYMALQGVLWMVFCAAAAFTALFMKTKGLSATQIGIVTATCGTVSAVMQPVLGRIVDDSKSLNWKKMSLILCAVMMLVCVLMLVLPGAWLPSICLGMLLLCVNCTIPFANSAVFYYQENGKEVNFGVARGIGSGAYAILAYIAGQLVTRLGINVVPISGLITCLLFTLILISMPYYGDEKKSLNEKTSSGNIFKLFVKYPVFTVMLVACLVMLTVHNLLSTYLIQIIEPLGGNGSHLGTTLAIQAVVEVPVLFGFGFIIKKIKVRTLMLVASLGYVAKAVLFMLANSIPMIYAVQLTQMFSFAIFASASVYYAEEQLEPTDRNTGQALVNCTMTAGIVLGSLIGGRIIDASGVPTLLRATSAIAVLGVAVAAASLLLENAQNKRREK